MQADNKKCMLKRNNHIQRQVTKIWTLCSLCSCFLKYLPAEASSNTRLSDWQSKKYCSANDLKSMVGSTDLIRGKRNGEEIEMEEGPLSKESGSHKQPGIPTKSTRYSLK